MGFRSKVYDKITHSMWCAGIEKTLSLHYTRSDIAKLPCKPQSNHHKPE